MAAVAFHTFLEIDLARSFLRPLFSSYLSYIFLIYPIFFSTDWSPSYISCLRVFHLIVNDLMSDSHAERRILKRGKPVLISRKQVVSYSLFTKIFMQIFDHRLDLTHAEACFGYDNVFVMAYFCQSALVNLRPSVDRSTAFQLEN
ncbi:hypothetical protein T05_10012 [Trichinella murrelli]|uniref:Uncharacterized protein n=1 Tax=Trichinella murrelli TaxID=144512 RepID=A0A0V0T6A9_9BILA|nr:hypothetical protein T05_10012 [Trichinella murrelli]